MASFVDSLTQNVFGDLSQQQMLDFEYSVMDLKEKSYAQIIGPKRLQSQLRDSRSTDPAAERFSSDYVYEETKRAVDGVAGSNTRICPGPRH